MAELKAAGIAPDAPLGEHQFVVRGEHELPVGDGTKALGVRNWIEAPWSAAACGHPEVTHGSSRIQAVGWDGGRCPVARTLLTYSRSSDPPSPYCADRTRMYSEERWDTARFCERDVLASPKLKVLLASERR